MSRIHAIVLVVVSVCTMGFISGALQNYAWAQEVIQVKKIDPQGQSALIKADSGLLRVIHPGDSVAPYGKVEMIDKERIVIKNEKLEKIILKFSNGKQTIQRIGKIDSTSQNPVVRITSTTDTGGNAVQSSAGYHQGKSNEEADKIQGDEHAHGQ